MKFLILDAGCAFHGQGGELNHLFTKVARETLEAFGHEVAVTEVGGDWKVEEEHEKIRAADVLVIPGMELCTAKKHTSSVCLKRSRTRSRSINTSVRTFQRCRTARKFSASSGS